MAIAVYESYSRKVIFPSRVSMVSVFILAVASAIIFALPVLAAWYSAKSTDVVLAGLVPWNDASGYFNCARDLLGWRDISAECSRRPFYSVMLANLMAYGGNNLQHALFFQGTIIGIASFFCSYEVWRKHGLGAALGIFATLFIFASQFVMTTMTENAGLLFGILAFYIFWRSTQNGFSLAGFAFAALILTIGLNARGGALFVLPALVVWLVIYNPGSGRLRGLAGAAVVSTAITIGFLSPFLLIGIFNGVIGDTHSNLPFMLYGLAAGGAPYTQIFTDNPEIFTGKNTGKETTRIMYEIIFAHIQDRPDLLAKGYILGLAHYFKELMRFFPYAEIRLIFFILWLAGVALCVKHIRNSGFGLLVFMQMGVFVSSPFMTWSSESRVFATTHPLDAAFVAIGLLALGNWAAKRNIFNIAESVLQVRPLKSKGLAVGGILVAMFFLSPLGLKNSTKFAEQVVSSCVAGMQTLVFNVTGPSPVLRLVEHKDRSIYPLRSSVQDFPAHMHPQLHLKDDLAKLPPGTALIWGYQLNSQYERSFTPVLWVGGEASIPDSGIVRICAEPFQPGAPFDYWVGKSITTLAED